MQANSEKQGIPVDIIENLWYKKKRIFRVKLYGGKLFYAQWDIYRKRHFMGACLVWLYDLVYYS